MSVAEATRTLIRFEAACLPECAQLAFPIHKKLNTPNYSQNVSLLPIPESVEAWRATHRTARKRADRAARLGYHFNTIDRSQHNDAIHEINTSKAERQGRPMSAGYLERHNHGPLPAYSCDRHYVQTYGVLQGDVLRAYLTLYRLGELALVSMILGHGDHEDAGIMYALFGGVVEDQAGQGGTFFYNRWDSGTDGLRFLKARLGFVPGDVEWQLA